MNLKLNEDPMAHQDPVAHPVAQPVKVSLNIDRHTKHKAYTRHSQRDKSWDQDGTRDLSSDLPKKEQ